MARVGTPPVSTTSDFCCVGVSCTNRVAESVQHGDRVRAEQLARTEWGRGYAVGPMPEIGGDARYGSDDWGPWYGRAREAGDRLHAQIEANRLRPAVMTAQEVYQVGRDLEYADQLEQHDILARAREAAQDGSLSPAIVELEMSLPPSPTHSDKPLYHAGCVGGAEDGEMVSDVWSDSCSDYS